MFKFSIKREIREFQVIVVQYCKEIGGTQRQFSENICSEDDLQGHPMDLFLKISVLQAHFCWLGDVKEIIVLGRKVLLGKR